MAAEIDIESVKKCAKNFWGRCREGSFGSDYIMKAQSERHILGERKP